MNVLVCMCSILLDRRMVLHAILLSFKYFWIERRLKCAQCSLQFSRHFSVVENLLVRWIVCFFLHVYRAARVVCVSRQRRQNSPWWFWLGLRAAYKSSQIYWLAGRSLRPPNTAPSHTTAFSERSRLQQSTQRKTVRENNLINSRQSGRAGLKRRMQGEWFTRESGAFAALTDGEKTDRGGDFLTRCKRMADWEGGCGRVEGRRVASVSKKERWRNA